MRTATAESESFFASFIEKQKRREAFQAGDDNRYYRSALDILVRDYRVFLRIEHVPNKKRGTPSRDRSTEAGRRGIAEAATRYPNSGAQGIVKSAIFLSQQNKIMFRFGLKCFHFNSAADIDCQRALVIGEVKSWRFLGYDAWVIERNADLSSTYRPSRQRKLYLLMPWISGYDLQRFFSMPSGQAINLLERMAMVQQIFSLLQRIGNAGKVFSDFKPQNIMYDPVRKKVVFIDLLLMENNSPVVVCTRKCLDAEKRAMMDRGERITFDWYDQMYVFGMLCVCIFSAEPEAPFQGHATLVNHMLAIFCNPDKTKRPSPNATVLSSLFARIARPSNGADAVMAPAPLQETVEPSLQN
jgi:serine/threonine protein kinase